MKHLLFQKLIISKVILESNLKIMKLENSSKHLGLNKILEHENSKLIKI